MVVFGGGAVVWRGRYPGEGHTSYIRASRAGEASLCDCNESTRRYKGTSTPPLFQQVLLSLSLSLTAAASPRSRAFAYEFVLDGDPSAASARWFNAGRE